ncbi:MAG TPA: PIN domain-containing protein [Thermoanaerobaculia bacterium]|nr:PIN domain-containing protein [Thermoanaerobaculia bacterium]
MVLVDTTIWSLALRRRAHQLSPVEKRLVEEWVDLVTSGRAVLTGPVRQEVLSGIRNEEVFEALHEKLFSFRYLENLPGDYVQAARFFNLCRSRGITGSHVDMLICALAYRYDMPIFTTDPDFPGYARHLPIRLHEPG